jgi:hypothetical protein
MLLSTYLVELIFVATLQKKFEIAKKTNHHSTPAKKMYSRFPFSSKYPIVLLLEYDWILPGK